MIYSFHPAAEDEFWEATARHERTEPGLGEDFLEGVDRTIQRILDSPERFPIHDHEARICCTKRFKYGIIYVLEDEEVIIVAVMHLHRRPGYWKRRLKKKK